MPLVESREAHGVGLALVPVALLLHNAEEALTLGAALSRWPGRAAELLGRIGGLPTAGELRAALLVVSVLGVALYALARWWSPGAYGLVVLQAVMTLNVFWHALGALAIWSYVPGLVTALLIQAPTSWVVYRQLQRNRSLTPLQWRLLLPLSFVIHGPLLLGLLWLVRRG